ncbi:helix-turn-helix domain-containing protein [Undibacterium sp. Ji67W]|uniref:helix-turn-helix domain-containing protein n=1 Tax=Undibacterium sp. Ji67W TaxID=3413042 RepID=UPI003BF2086D
MSEISQILKTIKHQLKLQSKTYRDVAVALDLSEASVKRLLQTENAASISIKRLSQISQMLGLSLTELMQEADAQGQRLHTLELAQERELVADTTLLLVAVCAINHWTNTDITSVYRISETECLRHLLKLDKLGLLSLLPGNRIRLNLARDFDWLPEGPIQNYFRHKGMPDFLAAKFNQDDQTLNFIHGMLTDAASSKLNAELRLLKSKFAELHTESLAAPIRKRRGTALLLAMREWEPEEFTALRRR